MAKAWQDFGKKLDDEAKDALASGGFDYGSYSSDDERIRAALDMLYHLPLWKKARYDDLKRLRNKYAYDEKGVDPFDISNAASIIGSWTDKTADDGKTKLTQGDQFYDQYWKADKNQREYWKDAVEGKLGKGAWEQVKLRMNKRLKDEAAAQADKDRRDIIEGNAEGQGIGDWLASAVGGLMLPRTKEKALEGKDIEGKDIALDAIETLAMTLPMAPATILGKVGAAAAVPLASEIMDAFAYDTDNQNDLAERADFNPVDVGVGAAINAVAPVAMQKAMRRIVNGFGGKSGQGASKEIMDAIKSLEKEGKLDVTREKFWQGQAASVRKLEAEQLENQALKPHKEAQGLMADEDQVNEAFEKLLATQALIDEGERTGNKKLLKGMYQQLDENLGNDYILKQLYSDAEEATLENGSNFRSELLGRLSEYSKMANKAARDAAEDAGTLTIAQRNLLKKSDDLYDLYNSGAKFTPAEELAGRLDDNLDNLIAVRNSGASKMDLFSLKHPKASALLSGLGESASTFAANKTGNQGNVERAVAPVESFLGKPGMLSKPLRKLQTEQREDARKAQSKAVLDSIAKSAENPEDRKWLEIIAKNPEIVKGIGAEALDPNFRKWMLVKGSDILRGTDLYRPTFKVE